MSDDHHRLGGRRLGQTLITDPTSKPALQGVVAEQPERILPKLSEFFGIAIYMYWGDHGPPHFHARYGGEKASFTLADLSILAGSLPPRALGLVIEWATLHRAELELAWQKASRNETPDSIEPLK